MKRHTLFLLALALLVLVFFYDVWLLGRVWFDSPGIYLVARISRGPFLANYSPILLASLLMPFEIQSITGYTTTLPRRHHKLFSAMATLPTADQPVFFYNYIELTERSLRSPLLDLFNVRYLLFSVDYPDLIPDERHRLVYSNEIRIYENLRVQPQAFVVHEARVIPDEEEMIRQMTSPDFDPRRTVLLEDPRALRGMQRPGPAPQKTENAKVSAYENERVVVDVSLESPGFLVLTDSYHPGWRVSVDGRPAKLLRANYLFRAVRLDAGGHRVEFVFAPKRFRTGVVLTGVTLLLTVGLLLVRRRTPRRKGEGAGS